MCSGDVLWQKSISTRRQWRESKRTRTFVCCDLSTASCMKDERGMMMNGEHTHRSGPRVYHAKDGDYTQKKEDKDGRITHSFTAVRKRSKHSCKKKTKTIITCARSSVSQTQLTYVDFLLSFKVFPFFPQRNCSYRIMHITFHKTDTPFILLLYWKFSNKN